MSQESGTPVESVSQTHEQMIEEVGSPAVEEEQELEASEEVVETEDGAEELEASGEEGEESASEEIEEEIKELKKKLKLKVDGQEIEEEIDFNDEDKMKEYLQKAKAFERKSEETAALRKQQEQILQMLQENPLAVLKELGHNLDELSYNHLQELMAEEKKSPEQKEAEAMKARLEELEKEREEFTKKQQEAEKERMRDEQANALQDDILNTLKEHTGLLSHEDPSVIGDVARALFRYNQAGQDVSTSDVIKVVEEQYINKLRQRSENWSEKDFNKIFGKKKMDSLRKARVSKRKAKTQTARQIPNSNAEPKQQEEAPVEKTSYKQFFSNHKGLK